ncbi:MAG: arginase family protein [Planctomycetota bacterium]
MNDTPPRPGDPVTADDGFLGCQTRRENARVVLIPVPFDATCSSRPGARHGPRAIVEGSVFLDVCDAVFGRFDGFGVHLEEAPGWVESISNETRSLVEPLLARGAGPEDRDRVLGIDAACAEVQDHVYARCRAALDEGAVPGVVGGEHGVSFGAIRASADEGPVGVLHIDAHFDLRERYLGVEYSHASVMRNVIDRLPTVERLVSVGIRDWSPEEQGLVERVSPRIAWLRDDDIARRTLSGEPWSAVCDEVVALLPDRVYVSFDIDGLEPGLCPNTGTPVPGGLTFGQASVLLETLAASGKTVIGFDLVEVAPRPGIDLVAERTLDGVVGARVLQKLVGCAVRSQTS